MQMEDELKSELIESDEDFRRLHEEHQNYEKRLEEITLKSFLSPQEHNEVKQIKLHKLSLKDRMAAILRTHMESRVSA